MRSRPGILSLLGLVAVVASAGAEVRLVVRPDGSKLLYNETPVQQARRNSGELLPAPSARLQRTIERFADLHGLDRRLVQAVIQVESGYNPRALSAKGAMGLMQLMPETARQQAVADPWTPEENVRGGTAYLQALMDRFDGELPLVLAAYNAGPEAVDRFSGVPPFGETRRYVEKVLRLLGRASSSAPEGRKIYLTRDENDHLRITTTPPDD